MRVTALLPAAGLMLAAAAALAQQPSPTPAPAEPVPTPPAATSPMPHQMPASPPMAERGDMHRMMMMHHGARGSTPSIRLRYGDLRLDLTCSPDDDAAACADIALGIIDHLRASDDRRGEQGRYRWRNEERRSNRGQGESEDW